jgi:hypothetical protein
MNGSVSDTPNFDRLPSRCAVAGAVLLAACLVAAIHDSAGFYRAYLIAFLFWIGVTVGCLAVLMLQHLTGGRWALVIRRILEAGTRTLPVMAVAALPILIGMKSLYVWARPGQIEPVIVAKHAYLNPVFFTVRMVFYFACWFVLAHFLNRWSREEDRGGNLPLWMRMESLSGGGLVLLGFTLNFAAVDWVMSLEPRWYSTIYGLLLMTGMTLGAMALVIVVLIWLSAAEPLSSFVTPAYFQDLGSILLMFVMLWTYLEFSQYLIIWGENLSGEIPWYLRRLQGGWGVVGLALVLLNFALPFFLLLFRHIKRRVKSLFIVALLVLVMRVVDLCWMVLPAFGDSQPAWRLVGMVVLLALGMGGLWFGYFTWQLQRLPLLPANDPRMKEVMEHVIEPG